MSSDEKEGAYCSICGGISPGKVTTKRITIGGKDIGIDKLDQIIAEVRALSLSDEQAILEEMLKRTRAFNYVPSNRSREYGEALLKAYKDG